MADCSILDESQHHQQQQQYEEPTKSILDVLHEDIGPIPTYILNLMKFLGYNNFLSIKDFDEKDIRDIEQFAQQELLHLIDCKSKDQLKQFYGVYHIDPKRFHFMPGHKKLLLNIKSYLAEKGREYFIRRTQILHHQESLQPLGESSPTYQPMYSRQQDDDDIDFYDGHDSSEDPPDYKKPRLLTQSQQLSYHNFNPIEHEQHIRSLVNKWVQASIPKFIKGTIIENPEDYAIIFHHRPEEGKLTAALQCCICKNNIGVSSQLRKSGSFRWLISNYMRHVKKLHFEKDDSPVRAHSNEMNLLYQPPIKLEMDEDQIRQF